MREWRSLFSAMDTAKKTTLLPWMCEFLIRFSKVQQMIEKIRINQCLPRVSLERSTATVVGSNSPSDVLPVLRSRRSEMSPSFQSSARLGVSYLAVFRSISRTGIFFVGNDHIRRRRFRRDVDLIRIFGIYRRRATTCGDVHRISVLPIRESMPESV